jgi:hypothetical protein
MNREVNFTKESKQRMDGAIAQLYFRLMAVSSQTSFSSMANRKPTKRAPITLNGATARNG